MKFQILTAGAFLILLTHPVLVSAATGEPACMAAFHSLIEDWNAIGFPTPAKPAQQLVLCNNNHVGSGGEVNFLQAQIRRAHKECLGGEDATALARIRRIEQHLDRMRPGQRS